MTREKAGVGTKFRQKIIKFNQIIETTNESGGK
jgi:hypothetical protein